MELLLQAWVGKTLCLSDGLFDCCEIVGRSLGKTYLPIVADKTFNFSFTFWLLPRGTISSWGSIFHVGDESLRRAPAIWTAPNTNVIYWTIDAVNLGNRFPQPPPPDLPQNVWVHLTVTLTNSKMLVYYNGALTGTVDLAASGGRLIYPLANMDFSVGSAFAPGKRSRRPIPFGSLGYSDSCEGKSNSRSKTPYARSLRRQPT